MSNKLEGNPVEARKVTCGIIMPISSIGECSADHWVEVRRIIDDVIDSVGFKSKLVSDADDSGIIQKRIIQNLYENEIVVCDVSCKNPNVMFELGLRLAFDKPTIIIKDDKTDYSFDTSVIDHLEYPRSLRFSKIVEFKKYLSTRIEATYNKSSKDPNYTTFLKHFGTYKVTNLDEKEITSEGLILSRLDEIQTQITTINSRSFEMTAFEKNRRFVLRREINNFMSKEDIEGTFEIIPNSNTHKKLIEYLINDSAIKKMFPSIHELTAEVERQLLPF